MWNNPWKEVALDDYENHMALSGVYQLQTLDRMMKEQFVSYAVGSVMILGVAGGNGLGNLVTIPGIHKIYGVDINAGYLRASAERYPQLAERYTTILADLNDDSLDLPSSEFVIANLFIEYVGCENFAAAVKKIDPRFVSCVIQIDEADGFVSDSPFADKLGILDSVHSVIDRYKLISVLKEEGYDVCYTSSVPLPNGKIFCRIDFEKRNA